eukprot:scaffold1006_cov270-Pinguiococcus_pyrenoidosus.AAC.11
MGPRSALEAVVSLLLFCLSSTQTAPFPFSHAPLASKRSAQFTSRTWHCVHGIGVAENAFIGVAPRCATPWSRHRCSGRVHTADSGAFLAMRRSLGPKRAKRESENEDEDDDLRRADLTSAQTREYQSRTAFIRRRHRAEVPAKSVQTAVKTPDNDFVDDLEDLSDPGEPESPCVTV